ncbi:hypothetical protein NLJ89_g7589 [Agrocybe chaxingu]|uniref:F-box domain-containing protein n=1 Tax=Agrocybe chaxingu TaxID=84603 RepID=A0A9W8MSZ2_9AGAR|nr:hypothetical protein NLJ89_g7589 [Agrocybe chaxingu]
MPEFHPHIQALSSQLLGRIFDFYAHNPDGERHLKGLETTLFSSCEGGHRANPGILLHVCQSWRTISLDRPSLWSIIIMTRPVTSHISRLENWLRLSKSDLLKLQITQTMPHDQTPIEPLREERTVVNAILEILLRHIKRWESITFLLTIGFLPAFSEFPQSQLEQLRSATLDLSTWTTHPEVMDRIFRAIHAAPKLEFMSGSAAFFQSPPDIPDSVPWQQLKGIELDVRVISQEPLTIHYVLAVLAKCPQLTSATFKLDYCQKSSPEAPRTILSMPNLVSLTLDDTSSADVEYVLRSVTLPSLHTLNISIDFESHPTSLTHPISGLLVRSKCTIRHLGLDVQEEKLVELLDLPIIRDVEVLRVGGQKTKDFASLLTRNAEEKSSLQVLPNLEYLHLNYTQDRDGTNRIYAPTSVMNAMVLSRTSLSPPAPGLKTLKFISLRDELESSFPFPGLGDVPPELEVKIS